MDSQVVFAILLLSVATVKAQDVTFWGETITLTCPGPGNFYISGNSTDLAEDTYTHKMKYSGSQDVYYCQYGENSKQVKYYFYVQGKACATCFEVDGLLFLVVIVVDLLGTIGLMLFVYSCAKRRRSAGPAKTPKSPARSGGRAPPVPSPDYEQLNHHSLAQGTYASVNQKR